MGAEPKFPSYPGILQLLCITGNQELGKKKEFGKTKGV